MALVGDATLAVRETAGAWVGRGLAPLFVVGTKARRKSRFVHPAGTTFHAQLYARTSDERLSGYALVRFSGAWWKDADRSPELLGCAVRLCAPDEVLSPGPHAQDLLFATLKYPWVLPAAFVRTQSRDFLANTYYGASPFDLEGAGPVKLRLRPRTGSGAPGRNRKERLLYAVQTGMVSLALEFRPHLRPGAQWAPLADLVLRAPAEMDAQALRFNPFQTGRGLRPRGFVQAIRKTAYPPSQDARQH